MQRNTVVFAYCRPLLWSRLSNQLGVRADNNFSIAWPNIKDQVCKRKYCYGRYNLERRLSCFDQMLFHNYFPSCTVWRVGNTCTKMTDIVSFVYRTNEGLSWAKKTVFLTFSARSPKILSDFLNSFDSKQRNYCVKPIRWPLKIIPHFN